MARLYEMNPKLRFVKYQAAGNDFILIDNRPGHFPQNAHLIQRMCHRQFGIGANGLILLSQPKLRSVRDGFRMQIFNEDGKEAESCGNGLRCLVKFLKNDLGIHKKNYRIQTQTQVVSAYISQGSHVVIDLGRPKTVNLYVETADGVVHLTDVGVPHAVQFIANAAKIDLLKTGADLRKALQANINFADLRDDGTIFVRTFERGVEGETLSCGTGAAAVGCIAFRIYGFRNPACIRYKGGDLEIREQNGHLFLSGPAEKTFSGSYLLRYPK